mmetsp:Transcript_2704/g.4588  ORF Transcript_2704/g.4588 Transcript_2704/m.4588 type:complete len:111 (-) Transcript_2704:254-586(-)
MAPKKASNSQKDSSKDDSTHRPFPEKYTSCQQSSEPANNTPQPQPEKFFALQKLNELLEETELIQEPYFKRFELNPVFANPPSMFKENMMKKFATQMNLQDLIKVIHFDR